MPGDYSPRDWVIWDCGHKTDEQMRASRYQAYLDRLYLRNRGYDVQPVNCPDCTRAAKEGRI